jgi:hypothetical protein
MSWRDDNDEIIRQNEEELKRLNANRRRQGYYSELESLPGSGFEGDQFVD